MSTLVTIRHDGMANGAKKEPLTVSVCECANGNELESYTINPDKELYLEVFAGCFLSLSLS